MKIDMELYNIFYCVAKYKNISKAASALYVSQPAISKSIKKLETLLNCTLFIRNSKGVILSKEGEVLYAHVSKAISEINMGEERIEKLINADLGNIRIGVSNTLCKHILIPHLKTFHELYPNIKFVVINNTTHDTLKLLNLGTIDFGLISAPFDSKSYNFLKLLEIHDTFVAKKNQYKELEHSFPLVDLCNYPIMLLEPENVTRQYLDRYFEKAKVELNPEFEMGSMEFLTAFAKIGLGIAAVIKEFVKDDLITGDLVEILVSPQPTSRYIGIVTHNETPISLGAQQFIKYLESNIK